jgi:hypothetical protein
MKEIADKIERPVKSNRQWCEEAEFHFANYEAMQQQLAECKKFDAWKANPYTKILEDSLAECQARYDEPAAWMYPSDLADFQDGEKFAKAFSICVGRPDEMSIPLYATQAVATDTLKRQWQREALVNIAVAVKEMGVFNYSVESIVEEIYNRAKELE